MAQIDKYEWYQQEHFGESKKKYKVREGSHEYIRHAYSAVDAIDRVATQYGWGNMSNIMYDADTRGDQYCECTVGWGGSRSHYMEAICIEEN